MNSLTVRKATPDDLSIIQELLTISSLPVEDVHHHLGHYMVAEVNKRIVGTIGLEVYPPSGLLRSATVHPDFRNAGIGKKLCELILSYAEEQGLHDVVLLTTTAASYFEKKGFVPIEREQVHPGVQSSAEFTSICPSSATCMKRLLR